MHLIERYAFGTIRDLGNLELVQDWLILMIFKTKKKEHNPNWSQLIDYLYWILRNRSLGPKSQIH